MTDTWMSIGKKMNDDLTARMKVERDLLENQLGTIYVADRGEIKIAAHSLFSSASMTELLRDKSSAGKSKASRLAEDKLIELTKLHATEAAAAAKGTLVSKRVRGEGLIMGIDPHTKEQRLPENRWQQIHNLIKVFEKEGKLAGEAYIVLDHNQIQKLQKKIVDDLYKWATSDTNELFVQPTGEKNIKGKETTLKRSFYLLNTKGEAGAQRIVQGGHGAGAGVSVAQVAAGRYLRETGLKALDTGDTALAGEANLLFKQLNVAFTDNVDPTTTDLSKLSTYRLDEIALRGVHNHFYDDSGRHKENFVTIVSFQSSGNNNFDSRREKALVKYLKDWLLKNFVTKYDPSKPYSPSLNDRVLSILTYGLSKELKKARVKGSVKAESVIKGMTEWNEISKVKIGQRVNTEKLKIKVKKGAVTQQARPAPKDKPAINALQLLAYINSRLPGTVRSNMDAPRLQNRTGRFSESTRATNVQITNRGFPSIGYTYEKSPYQVFEMGVGKQPWATPDRDPRSLIDKSIREIAAQLFIGRMYTRRM